MNTLLDYADKAAPITPETLGAEVYQRFEAEPETFAIAVVDVDGRPVGIVDRNDFFLHMGAEFGRALYGSRPIRYVMRPPRIETADTDVMEFLGQVISVNRAGLLDGFIVVDTGGKYLAVGTALSLLSAGHAAAKARVRELAAKSTRLHRAERKAQAASRAKSQFLAIMSHEIRTPLNGVLAVAEIIDRKLGQEELRPYVHTILDSGRTLHRLLTDALDLSRAEAGAMEICPEATDLAALIHDLERLWRPLAADKGLDLSVVLRGERAQTILVDQVRLKQILNNLVGNALKFTAQGKVEARFELTTIGGEQRVVCEVQDTGPGIEAEQLERIFEPFAKADEHRGGAGLGLAICRQLVGAMGGELKARSTPGFGSTFYFALTFPQLSLVPDREPQALEGSKATGRVLVVDDNAANRLVACTMLEMAGVASATANDGVEAVELAAREAFDAILMDVKMPRMDGIQAARTIRAAAGPNQTTPIVAVTANADPTDAHAYAEAGMNGLVTKPLSAETLLGAVAKALEAGAEAAVAQTANAA